MRLFPALLIVTGLISIEPATGAVLSYAPSMAISPGTQVVDVAGRPVGTVQRVRGNQLIIRTDRHEVRLPTASFTPDKGRLVFGMTREALNQATDAMLAKALLPGAEVYGKNGALIGAIAAINQQYVTLDLQSGERIRLPRNAVGPGANGAVLGITVAELQQMLKQAQTSTP